MSDVQRYLLTIDRNKQEAAEIANDTANQIESKQIKLVDVVQTLGEYLTDDDATVRAKAIAYFSAVLAALPPNFLTRQHVSVTVQFLCDRLEDAVGLRETAEGLIAVQKHDRFSKDNGMQVAGMLFTSCQELQQHPQGTRFVVYNLLDSLMYNHRQALKDMRGDSVVGIVDLISGEKDPRNLMMIFSMLKVVLVEWDITNHVEALFDAVFCYFPITFRPPPDDPYGITAQDLKTRLRECIAASSAFAGHAFPALLDKLDSTSPNVKNDVLRTISACVRCYSPAVVALHSTTLWDSIKYEILNAQDDELANEALSVIQGIAERLSYGLTKIDPQTALARFVQAVSSECNDQLREPQQKQAKSTGQILQSVAKASPVALSLIAKAIIPPLLAVYNNAGEIGKRQALLNVLLRVFDAAIEVFGRWGLARESRLDDDPLEPFADALFRLCSQALMSTIHSEHSFRVTAVHLLLRLVSLRDFLSSDEISMSVQYLDEVLLAREPQVQEDLRNEAINALVEISRFRSDLIMDVSFPAFMATLPDRHPTTNTRYLSSLEVLARLSVEKNIFELLLRRMTSKVQTVLKNKTDPAYPHAILMTLYYVLDRRDLEKSTETDRYYNQFVTALLKESMKQNLDSAESAIHDESVLDGIGRVVNVVIRALPEKVQEEIIKSGIYNSTSLLASVSWGQNPVSRLRTEVVSTYFLAALRREVSIPYESRKERLELLATHVLSEADPTVRLALVRQICLIVNKWLASTDSAILDAVLAPQLEHLITSQTHTTAETIQNALRILFWTTKGLVLRIDSHANHLLDRLLDLLAHPAHGQSTARGFAILLAPDDVVCKANHAIIRLLHKQRMFNHCVPTIASRFRAAEVSLKPNYLVALAGLLRFVPSNVVMPQLDTLVPLLLQSVDLPNADVKAATLDTLTVTVQESPQALESHISSLIARLLNSASSINAGNPPRVRLAALQGLRIFPAAFKQELLLPYRKAVSKRLMEVLDDPKRNVRKEAVDCRSAWLRMDEPDDE